MKHPKKTKNKGGAPMLHGATSYLTRLTLPDNRLYLRPYLTGVREELIRDLAETEEDLPVAKRLLVDRVVGLTGVIRLIEEFCREAGVFRGTLLQPVLAQYLSFNHALRQNLQALGLERRVVEEKVMTIAELTLKVRREQAEEAGEAAIAPRTGDKGEAGTDECITDPGDRESNNEGGQHND